MIGDLDSRFRGNDKNIIKNIRVVMKKLFLLIAASLALAGCTVKAVGDPNRPITINANVIVDVRGLKQTANGIEDMVAQGAKK